MNKAVLSYNFGNYDKVEPIYFQNPEWDFYLFTDREMAEKPEGWEVVIMPEDFWHSDNPKRRANQIKYTPFSTLQGMDKEYDILIVMDANIAVEGNLNDFVDIHCMSTMDGVFITHPTIDSVYEDIDLCAELKKDEHDILLKTYKHFKEKGCPDKVNYFQTTLSIRRNTSAWRVIEYWFYKEYENFSKRDQPMMNFMHWKYDVLDLNLIDLAHIHEYLKYDNHHFEKK